MRFLLPSLFLTVPYFLQPSEVNYTKIMSDTYHLKYSQIFFAKHNHNLCMNHNLISRNLKLARLDTVPLVQKKLCWRVLTLSCIFYISAPQCTVLIICDAKVMIGDQGY